MQTPSSEREARSQIEKRLGTPIRADVWELLIDYRWISDFMTGGANLEEVAEYAIRLSKLQRERSVSVRKERRQPGGDARRLAISAYLAADARADKGVTQFRGDFLGGRLLKRSEVELWLQRECGRARVTRRVALLLPDGIEPKLTAKGWELCPPLIDFNQLKVTGLISNDLLGYIPDGSDWASYIGVPYDGPVRKLFELTTILVRRFGWLQAQATMFVLTDDVPIINSIQLSLAERHPYRSQMRISISIDPGITPRELAHAYNEYRAKLIPRVPRSMGEKAARLAMFVLDRPKLTVLDMNQWNELHPAWAYSQFRRFRESAYRARKQMHSSTRKMIVDLTATYALGTGAKSA